MDKYLVIGEPIAHSISPLIHARFAKDTGQNIQYGKQRIAPADFNNAVDDLIKSGIKGLNITLPLKEHAFAYADSLSQRAKLAGAVNTFKIDKNKVIGDNTDGIGLVKDLTTNLKMRLNNKRILLLGAGGAARGIIKPLLDESPNVLVIANRTASKAKDLADKFKNYGLLESCGFAEISGRFDLILNATSASISGEVPPIPDSAIDANTVAYDLMYAKQATAFMSWAKNHHAKTVSDGLGMLLEQAAESFFIWRQVRPSTKNLLQELR